MFSSFFFFIFFGWGCCCSSAVCMYLEGVIYGNMAAPFVKSAPRAEAAHTKRESGGRHEMSATRMIYFDNILGGRREGRYAVRFGRPFFFVFFFATDKRRGECGRWWRHRAIGPETAFLGSIINAGCYSTYSEWQLGKGVGHPKTGISNHGCDGRRDHTTNQHPSDLFLPHQPIYTYK